ncbi:prepilin-type N-terminal cleavage/methylation domain-containing protein [Psychrobacter sp. 16-MNA-CIBAN-0192]|uniref:prepilin-type N-terminal cleavage/methylation domain-containing protein n=1 Tax=Psychrobacter sp. 16-MNA-CIBAN-0192 TaxID=3140448 RepID=UPI00331B7AD6
MQQRGFTLLELMVAMAIFAVLAIAGWQVFDSVNRARERAQFHADQLAVLQYAYLQIQQDMGQMVPYHSLMVQEGNNNLNNSSNNNANNGSPNNSANTNVAAVIPEPFISLDSEQLSFIRFADPDPRYKTSPILQRIAYIFTDEKLIRRQYVNVQGGIESISLDSVVLAGVTAGRWQAFLPEISATFPNKTSDNQNNNVVSGQAENADSKPPMLLPKGIGLAFTYQELPITWQWALAPQAIPLNRHTDSKENANNIPNNNTNGNNSNNSPNNNTNGNDEGNSNGQGNLLSGNAAVP